jgi:zinc transporter
MDVVFRFLEDMTDILAGISGKQAEIVDEIEDLVLKDRFLRDSEELGAVRRLLTRVRRHVDAQRHAMSQLVHRPPAWFCEKDTQDLRRAIEHLNAVFLDLEAIQDRARLLQDEIAARIANATNRNLYVVSLLTAVFLPITLISGIFGMNVGGLPWETQSTGFIWVIGVMLLTIMISLGLLHWRRFF